MAPNQPTTLWNNNIALVQLLGLCPLLAVTTSVTNGLGLGVATLLVITITTLLVSLFRRLIPSDARIVFFVLVIASLVTAVELVMKAYFPDLFHNLGIFVPLILCNCAILGRADAFAYHNGVVSSTLDGLVTGLGFALALVLMGAMRELLGNGTLFAGLEMLVGEAGRPWTLNLFSDGGFLLALTPPGAFLCLGMLVALHRYLYLRKTSGLPAGTPSSSNP